MSVHEVYEHTPSTVELVIGFPLFLAGLVIFVFGATAGWFCTAWKEGYEQGAYEWKHFS